MNKNVKLIVIIGLTLNILLTIIKISSGLIGDSYSLFSDGINSLSDVIISVTLILTIKYASKKPDKDHPYGHQKYEAVTNMFLGIFLLITAVLLTVNSIHNINNINNPKTFTMAIAGVSILIKIVIYLVNINGYKKYNQISLKADAYNHLGDILATSLSLISIILARNNILYVENIAGILISIIIFINGLKVIKDATNYMVDLSPKTSFNKKVKKFINSIDGVIKIDDYKSRLHVTNIYIDVEIQVDRNLSLLHAHKIAEDVHIKVEERFEKVLHCMVHVNPSKEGSEDNE